MDEIKVLISSSDIDNKVDEIARQIEYDFGNEPIVLICILKGSLFFTADLARKINNENLLIDFMKVSSYGNKTTSNGDVTFKLDTSIEVKDKNIILVEDIVDTGYTLKYLRDVLSMRNPKSLKICAILNKESRRKVDIHVDYMGFSIEDKFVVGYGMDYAEKYRNLPYIGYLDN